MPIFALPLAPTASASKSRVHFSSLPVRKRKRDSSPDSASSNEDAQSSYDNDVASLAPSSLAAASTNPNSLTPQEVVQWKLAGLGLDETAPDVRDWPHRGLSDLTALAGEREVKVITKRIQKANIQDSYEDEDEEGHRSREDTGEGGRRKADRGPRLRLQHLSVLTTILQRCLLDKDFERAGRAWSMLIRAQVGGKGVDLRGSGYWMIGSELLIKGHDKSDTRSGYSGEKEHETADKTRWGSVVGLEKAKEYYERLILQHPYKRQFHGNISVLDFWATMVGCEIYGIQYEQKEALRNVTLEKEGEDGEGLGSRSEAENDDVEHGDEGGDAYVITERRDARKRLRRAEKRWQDRDGIRKTALMAYEKIAARLDDLMTAPPYSDYHVLVRLRGMLALCIGDFSVPAPPIDDNGGNEDEEDEEALDRNRRLGIGGKDTERRLLLRQRLAEYNRGKMKQKEERMRATKLFDKIDREGGRQDIIRDSLGNHDGYEEGSYDAGS